MSSLNKGEARKQFEVLDSCVYLNHAAVGLIPKSSHDAIISFVEDRSKNGPNYQVEKRIIEETRGYVAKFLNVGIHEIAFVSNTSSGISKIANGIKLKNGDRIACIVPDFPSNIYPWIWQRNRGLDVYTINVNFARFSVKRLATEIRSRTRLVTLSHANYVSGFKFPLGEICTMLKKMDIMVFVDMIQTLGSMPVDLREMKVDFMAAGAHKWLMGLPGAGILYIAEEVMPFVNPVELGWKSVKHEEDFQNISLDLKEDASVMEPGTMNTVGILAMKKGIEFLLGFGLDYVSKEILEWNMSMGKELRSMGYEVHSPFGDEYSSGILSFSCNDPERVFRVLCSEGIKVSMRGGLIRLSPHFYNDEKDLERVGNLLRRCR